MKKLNHSCLRLLLLASFAMLFCFIHAAHRVEEPITKPREEVRPSETGRPTQPPREREYLPPRETGKEPSGISREPATGQAEPPVSYTIETKQPTSPTGPTLEEKVPTITPTKPIISTKPPSEFETSIPATQPKQEWEPIKNPTNREDASRLASEAEAREQGAQDLLKSARARGDTIAERGAQRLVTEARYDKTTAQITDNEFKILNPDVKEYEKNIARSKLAKAQQEHNQAAKDLGIQPRSATITLEPGPLWNFVLEGLAQEPESSSPKTPEGSASLTTPQEAGKRWWKRLVDSFTEIFTRKAEKAAARKTIDLDTALRTAQSEMQKYKSSWKGTADTLAQDKQFLTLHKATAEAQLTIALDNLENYTTTWKGSKETLANDSEFKALQKQVTAAQQGVNSALTQLELANFNDLIKYFSNPAGSDQLINALNRLANISTMVETLNNPAESQNWEQQETNTIFSGLKFSENPYSVLLLENDPNLPLANIKDQFETLNTFLSDQLASKETALGKNSLEYSRATAKYQADIERLNEAYTALTKDRAGINKALKKAQDDAKERAQSKKDTAPANKAAIEEAIKNIQNDAYAKVKAARDRLLRATGKSLQGI